LTSFIIQGPAPAVGPGQTAQLKAIARYSDGSERDVSSESTWSSTQPQIATAEGGLVRGIALGRTIIRALYSSRNASLTMVIEPEGTFIVSGNITEPGGLVVGGATVAVVSGPANSVKATTSGGFYELFGVAGMVTVRVSNPGYVDEMRTITVADNQKLNVEIRPVVAPSSIGGTYVMVLTISPSCSVVPDDFKTRTYTATIGQDNARITVDLFDATFTNNNNRFTGRISGSTVTFDLTYTYYGYYYGPIVQEAVSPTQVLGIGGKMTASTTQPLSGNLVGGMTFRDSSTRSSKSCSASDNRVVFTRK